MCVCFLIARLAWDLSLSTRYSQTPRKFRTSDTAEHPSPFPSSPHPPQSTYRIWRSEGKDLSAAEAARSMKAISDAAPNRHHPTVGYKASVLHPCHPLTSSPNSQRSLPRWTLSAGGDMDKSEICAKNIFSCLPLACWARRRLWQSTLVRTPVV